LSSPKGICWRWRSAAGGGLGGRVGDQAPPARRDREAPPPPAQLVLAGTVSTSVTGPLSCVPLLTTLRLYTTVAPGVPVPLARLLARWSLTVPAVGVATLPNAPRSGASPSSARPVLLSHRQTFHAHSRRHH